MQVELMAHTNVDNILDFVGDIAGICTGKEGVKNIERALRCIRNGHLSILEHVSFTWRVSGISRACSHQLVRHRIASYTQGSQRYIKVDDESKWYVTPKTIEESSLRDRFNEVMRNCFEFYKSVIDNGIKLEDARYIIPNACNTDIIITMNLREFLSFFELRTSKFAQWEIRDLAYGMYYEVRNKFPEIIDIVENSRMA